MLRAQNPAINACFLPLETTTKNCNDSSDPSVTVNRRTTPRLLVADELPVIVLLLFDTIQLLGGG